MVSHFFATDFTDFHRFLFFPSVSIRETCTELVEVFVAEVWVFLLKTVEPKYFNTPFPAATPLEKHAVSK